MRNIIVYSVVIVFVTLSVLALVLGAVDYMMYRRGK